MVELFRFLKTDKDRHKRNVKFSETLMHVYLQSFDKIKVPFKACFEIAKKNNIEISSS